jgi:hypothetical protein
MSSNIVTKNWFLWDNDIWVALDLSLATLWLTTKLYTTEYKWETAPDWLREQVAGNNEHNDMVLDRLEQQRLNRQLGQQWRRKGERESCYCASQ